MGLATFIGGIHPYEGKELSENKPVQVLMPKGDLVYPMSQHIGAPAKPLVAKGDHVLAGQKIGEAGGFISANVIASVSGTVKAIEPRRMANGAMVPSIVVENDGEYKTVEGVGEDRDPSGLSKEEIRNIVKEAGIVGLGGAGFPTHVKLTPKDENAIEYILVYGTGENVRDWLHVADHCEAIDLVIHKGREGEVYNIGGHNERTNLEVVKTILKALDKPESLIRFVTDRPGHDMRYAIDPTKIETELGWEPKYNFDSGIQQTIQWYLDNQEWWKNILSGEYSGYFDKMYGNRL